MPGFLDKLSSGLLEVFTSAVPEEYCKPTYKGAAERVDLKKLRRLIQDGKLAPLFPGSDDASAPAPEHVAIISRVLKKRHGDASTAKVILNSAPETEECPVCCMYFAALNTSRCCGKRLCTECYLQVQTSRSHPPPCPFCKVHNFSAKLLGLKTVQEREAERLEEQKVIEAQLREREEEAKRDKERLEQRTRAAEERAASAAGASSSTGGASAPAPTSFQPASSSLGPVTSNAGTVDDPAETQDLAAHGDGSQASQGGAAASQRYDLQDFLPSTMMANWAGHEGDLLDLNELMLEQAMYESAVAAARAAGTVPPPAPRGLRGLPSDPGGSRGSTPRTASPSGSAVIASRAVTRDRDGRVGSGSSRHQSPGTAPPARPTSAAAVSSDARAGAQGVGHRSGTSRTRHGTASPPVQQAAHPRQHAQSGTGSHSIRAPSRSPPAQPSREQAPPRERARQVREMSEDEQYALAIQLSLAAMDAQEQQPPSPTQPAVPDASVQQQEGDTDEPAATGSSSPRQDGVATLLSLDEFPAQDSEPAAPLAAPDDAWQQHSGPSSQNEGAAPASPDVLAQAGMLLSDEPSHLTSPGALLTQSSPLGLDSWDTQAPLSPAEPAPQRDSPDIQEQHADPAPAVALSESQASGMDGAVACLRGEPGQADSAVSPLVQLHVACLEEEGGAGPQRGTATGLLLHGAPAPPLPTVAAALTSSPPQPAEPVSNSVAVPELAPLKGPGLGGVLEAAAPLVSALSVKSVKAPNPQASEVPGASSPGAGALIAASVDQDTSSLPGACGSASHLACLMAPHGSACSPPGTPVESMVHSAAVASEGVNLGVVTGLCGVQPVAVTASDVAAAQPAYMHVGMMFAVWEVCAPSGGERGAGGGAAAGTAGTPHGAPTTLPVQTGVAVLSPDAVVVENPDGSLCALVVPTPTPPPPPAAASGPAVSGAPTRQQALQREFDSMQRLEDAVGATEYADYADEPYAGDYEVTPPNELLGPAGDVAVQLGCDDYDAGLMRAIASDDARLRAALTSGNTAHPPAHR